MNSLVFKKLVLTDIPEIKRYLKENPSQLTDWTVGGIFLWRDLYDIYFTIYQDTLILKVQYFGKFTAFCINCQSMKESVREAIKQYCAQMQIPTVYCLVDDCSLNVLKEQENIHYLKEERDLFDYLYLVSDLSTYSGKKFQTQRNHVNHFLNQYAVERYIWDGSCVEEIIQFLDTYYQDKVIDSDYLKEEKEKTYEAFLAQKQYQFETVLIKADGKLVAVASGEIIGDTAYQHIEKALVGYEGVYSYIAKSFAKHMAQQSVMYINREDDNGDEGLRYSKMKYRPIQLLKKYSVEVCNDTICEK